MSAVRSCSGKVLVALRSFCSEVFLIRGASHAGGFLNEDAKQHALKEHSKMVNTNKACAAFEIVSRERGSLVSVVVVLVGNVCRWCLAALSVDSVSRWCQSVVSRWCQSVVSVGRRVSRCCQSVFLVGRVSRCQ